MDFLLDPNVAYLVLMVGILLTLFAIVTPGTGLLEIGAFFALAMAGYAVLQLYNSFNLWAVILIVLSIVPFLLAARRPKREFLLAISLLGFALGSVFLFTGENWIPEVNPVLATVTTILVTGFLWIAVRKAIQAAQKRPSHDLDALIGKQGDARTEVREEGSVQVNGELWSARSEHSIPAGSHIRVVKRDGFILLVEKDK